MRMRGWTSDFTPYEPAARAAVRVLPADFDVDRADAYLDAPRAPEVLECERCNPRACHALLKQGRTLKPDCAAFLVMDATPPVGPLLTTRVLAALREHGPQTMHDLTTRLGVKYFTLRHHIDTLQAAGCIGGVGVRVNGNGRAKVYAAIVGGPAAPEPFTRPGHAKKRVRAANETRIVELLTERGPLAVSDLAALTGLHPTSVLDRLHVLAAAHAVRQAGQAARVAEDRGRRYYVQLWAVTEADNV